MAEYLMSEIQIPAIGDPVMIVKDKEARDDLSTAVVETEASNPLTFTTRSAQKAQSAEIVLEPIQDLHGYDHPWPAGGGKNLLPFDLDAMKALNTNGSWSGNVYTFNGISFTVNTDGTVTADGTATANTVLYYHSENNIYGGYIFNGAPSGSESGTGLGAQYYEGSTFIKTDFDYGSGVTIDSNSEYQLNLLCRVASGKTVSNFTFKPMLRLSTETDPTFAPYSNYCPIDGHTEVSLAGCGKNWFDGYTVYSDYMQSSGVYKGQNTVFNVIEIQIPKELIGKILTFSMKCTEMDSSITAVRVMANVNDRVIRGNGITLSALGVSSVTFTPETSSDYIKVTYGSGAGSITFTDVQLELGSTATECEPYTPSNDLTKDLGQEVFGGSYNPVSGELVVTWGYIAEYNGETLPGEWISDRDVYAPNTSPSTGAEVCYELATPITYHLSPNEIKLLSGVNTVWTDGTSIEVAYRDGKVATLADLQDTANNLQEQIDQNETMEDETTQLLYKLGVNNGLLFMEEV